MQKSTYVQKTSKIVQNRLKYIYFQWYPPTEEGRPSQGEGASESVKNRKFSKWVVLLPEYNNAKKRNLLLMVV